MEQGLPSPENAVPQGSLRALYNRVGLKRTVCIALRRTSTIPTVKKFLMHHTALTNHVDRTLQRFIRPRVAAKIYPLAIAVYGLSWAVEPLLIGGIIGFGAIAATTLSPTAMLVTTGLAAAWAFNLAVGVGAAAFTRYGYNVGARAKRIQNPPPKPRGLRIN
ncbi:MAG: hypothetical protein KGQ41_09470 [Alphaproteobacteria bacterium]|nr:hypothetical protein [Alphaproteobacteria bacterium]